MFKQAWRSYIASLHPRNYKKINIGNSMLWFSALYWFIINPIMQAAINDSVDAGFEISFWIANLTPYYLMWWSNAGGRLPMPKQMYLLTMKKAERGEYIQTLMGIKIGFPLIVGLVLQLVRGILYGIDPLRVVLCTSAIASFGIGMYVCSSLRSKFDRYIRYAIRGKDGTGKDAFLNWMCMIGSIIYNLLVASVEVSQSDSLWKLLLWTIIAFLIIIVMDIAIIKTRYQATIEDVCNYEEAFNILGKVIK